MIITKEWLKKNNACLEGVSWFTAQSKTDAIPVIKQLMTENKLDWASWTICRVFNYKQKLQYSVFAAEQVISIYEKRYPDDNLPRKAIKAARKCIENQNKENMLAAYAAAANAANAAAYAANAPAYAAHAPANAADAAYAARKELTAKIEKWMVKRIKGKSTK